MKANPWLQSGNQSHSQHYIASIRCFQLVGICVLIVGVQGAARVGVGFVESLERSHIDVRDVLNHHEQWQMQIVWRCREEEIKVGSCALCSQCDTPGLLGGKDK